MPGDLILISAPDPSSLGKSIRRLSGNHFSWAYLGQDVVEMAEVQAILGPETSFVDTAKRFHEAAETLRGPYLTELYRAGRDLGSLRWWISSVSYRSGTMSKSFHHICLLKSGLDLTSSWGGPGPLILVAQDTVREALKRNLRPNQDIRLEVIEPARPTRLSYFADVGRMLLHRLFFVGRESYRIRTARRLIPDLPRVDGPTAVLLSWATPHNIHLREEFHRSFFGDLADGLEQLGCSVAIAPIIVRDLDYREALGHIQNTSRPVLLPHRYLGYWDLIRAAIATFPRPPRPPFAKSFCGMDIRSLIDADLRTHWISNAAADSLLMLPLLRRWAALGFDITRFIYIFENQPLERAICWEARNSFPKATVVGFQHSGTGRFRLNVHLAPGGEPEAPLPDRIVTIGRYTAGVLRENGHKPETLTVGGALHMQGLVEQMRSVEPAVPEDGVPTILVAPSDRSEDAAELTMMAANLFDKTEPVRVILKYHPLLPFQKLRDIAKISLPDHVEIRDEPITKLMSQSSMLVYSDSAVAFQALALGLPAIHVITRFDLDLDPLDGARDTRLEAMGIEELRGKILWLLANKDEYLSQHKSACNSLVESAYGPVTEDTFRAFVE